jgi:HEAT repeat protein
MKTSKTPPNARSSSAARARAVLWALACILTLAARSADPSATALTPDPHFTQSADALTPLQRQVERERRRLSSSDAEERREAVTRLGALGRPEGARAAAAALADRAPVVRATAARAVVSLGPADVASLLTPLLLRDRDEFVRREVAYALGLARSRPAVPSLIQALEADKQPSVRGAAAVALGQIADQSAVEPLAAKLSERRRASGIIARVTRRRTEEDEFVRRSAAVSLGQIGSRDAVPALVEILTGLRSSDDLRREAARALGAIGDPSAAPALRAALSARDPHLSRIAHEALRRLEAKPAPAPEQKQNGR